MLLFKQIINIEHKTESAIHSSSGKQLAIFFFFYFRKSRSKKQYVFWNIDTEPSLPIPFVNLRPTRVTSRVDFYMGAPDDWLKYIWYNYCVKSVQIRTRKISVFGHFSRSELTEVDECEDKTLLQVFPCEFCIFHITAIL